MKATPLSPALGVEICDVELSTLDDTGFAKLRTLWNEANGLAVVRDQQLTPESQTMFSRRFGPLFGEDDHFQSSVQPYLLPGHPTIYRVSNKKSADGAALGRAKAGSYWHSDVSFRSAPAMASLLYAIEVPGAGGDTLFASQVAAFGALSPAMQQLLQPLDAVHDFRVAAQTSGSYAVSDLDSGDFDGTNRAEHPVVIGHPESGRHALFVNPGFTSHLSGFDRDESDVLLGYLYRHVTRAEFVYRHRWRQGDLVIWDNRATIHLAVQDYSADRYLHRSTVIAERPVRA